MNIEINKIYSSVFYFLRNQIINISILIVLSTSISMFVNYIFSPNSEQFFSVVQENVYLQNKKISLHQFLKNMSNEQKNILLKISIVNIISNLLGNLFLISSIVNMISLVSKNNIFSINQIVNLIFPDLLKLFFLMLNMTFLIQIGIIFFVLPGIFMTIFLSLSPIILIKDKFSIVQSMILSIKISYYYFKIIAPSVILWILIKITLMMILTQINIFSYFSFSSLLTIINNIIYTLLILYLYRFYMLINIKNFT